AAGNAIKEGVPQRTGVLAGRDRGYAGDQVLGAVLAHDAGAQVDHALKKFLLQPSLPACSVFIVDLRNWPVRPARRRAFSLPAEPCWVAPRFVVIALRLVTHRHRRFGRALAYFRP